jgi:glycosyltransferase involved in cell wall biosynthesis
LKKLLYINQIFLDEPTGQGSFEQGLIESLLKRVKRTSNVGIRIFSVRRAGSTPKSSDVEAGIKKLLLVKDNKFGYLSYQMRLFWELGRELWSCRQDDVTIYVRYNPSMISAALLAILGRRRLVLRTGPVFQSMRDYRPDLKGWVYLFAACSAWFFYRKADRVIVATRKIGELLQSVFPFITSKLVVISNGADTEKFKPLSAARHQWGIPDSTFVLGYVGQLDPVQGLQVVINAIAVLERNGSKIPLLLAVGDGPSRGEWEDLGKRLGVNENIRWVGRIPHEEIPSVIAACDVMLLSLTRHTLETRGTSATKLFEYLACDKPVLASRCEDLLFIEQDDIGRLVEPEDIQGWASAIQEVMNTNRSDLGLKGRARELVIREYSFDAVAKKIWSACFD